MRIEDLEPGAISRDQHIHRIRYHHNWRSSTPQPALHNTMYAQCGRLFRHFTTLMPIKHHQGQVKLSAPGGMHMLHEAV